MPNKINRTVKDALTGAAERIGADGHGAGGMDGFVEAVGRQNLEFLAASIVRSCVPPAKDPEDAAAGGTVVVLEPVSIPSGHFFVELKDGSLILIHRAASF